MGTDISGSIILLAVLLALSVYFSATETSITAAGKAKLLALSDEHPDRKKGFMWLIDNMSKAINVTLVGNNLVNIAASSVATSLALRFLGRFGPVYAVAVMTALIVVFCEILPKNYAIAEKESVVMRTLPLLHKLYIVMWPLIWLLQMVLKGLSKLTGLDLTSYSNLVSREEIDHIVSEGGASGVLEDGERKMIHGVIEFEDTRVSEVMAPRTDMCAIDQDDSIDKAAKLFISSGHSRIPVFKDDIDNVLGILYAKDLLGPLSHNKKVPITSLMRKPVFVPETMKTDEALEIMKKSKKHMAIVVDEYGGVAGVITLEDLIEEIVGDIQDEYDKETPDISKEADNSYLVQGQVNLEDLSEALNYHFDSAFDEVDTLAGMILEILGNFPKQDETLQYGPWDIHVLDVQNHRILLVRMKYVPERAEAEEEDE